LFVIPQRPIVCHSAAQRRNLLLLLPLPVLAPHSRAAPEAVIPAQPLKSSFWRSQNLCICLVFLMLTASTLPNDEKTQ
jgi:hypothetical protein